jgi:hypothetical protein
MWAREYKKETIFPNRYREDSVTRSNPQNSDKSFLGGGLSKKLFQREKKISEGQEKISSIPFEGYGRV